MRFTEVVLSGVVVWKFERKRVLDPAWQHLWELLPSHVREVLGPKRNLLLLREMLVSAGYADETLVDDLALDWRVTSQWHFARNVVSIG